MKKQMKSQKKLVESTTR